LRSFKANYKTREEIPRTKSQEPKKGNIRKQNTKTRVDGILGFDLFGTWHLDFGFFFGTWH